MHGQRNVKLWFQSFPNFEEHNHCKGQEFVYVIDVILAFSILTYMNNKLVTSCTCNMSALQWMSCTHHLQLWLSLSPLLPCPHQMHLSCLMCSVWKLETVL